MWPYINLEDLCSKSLMMLFVTSRAHNLPELFARADFDATHLGRISLSIEVAEIKLKEYTLFIEGETNEAYGRLISWKNDPSASRASMQKYIPGEGLMAMECQEKIYDFLVKCCKNLLEHEMKDDVSLLDDRYPISPPAVSSEPELIPAVDGENWPTLASMATEAPFRLPAKLNFNRIKAVLAAKRSAAEDHIWAMREDPGYFAETIRDWGEHRNDSMPDTNGDPYPTGPHTIEFWVRVIRNAVNAMYADFMAWNIHYNQASRLGVLQEKYKDDISPDKKLPKEYLVALLNFREL
jgi:hypothetical protein